MNRYERTHIELKKQLELLGITEEEGKEREAPEMQMQMEASLQEEKEDRTDSLSLSQRSANN